jgi:hypothetical protein
VVKGRFQNPSRKNEFRFIKISLHKSSYSAKAPADFPFGKTQTTSPKHAPDTKGKIVQFRPRKKFENGNDDPERA